MRTWSLGMGDPLSTILAADFRREGVDYANDQIWELGLGGGDPPAVAVRTTYGLRARSMRIFPLFRSAQKVITNPAEFHEPPRLCRFTPGFLVLQFSPFEGIEVNAEYWAPSSQTLACRLTVANRSIESQAMQLDLCALLHALDGQSLGAIVMQAVYVLSGRTSGLAPVIFLTGGPLPGAGPYPSLTIDLNLAGGSARQLTWVHAALEDAQASFELARRTAARPWDAECARMELSHASQILDIQTGDPDWDAAFTWTQRMAFSLFYPAGGNLAHPACVQSRVPDKGFAASGKWSGYAPASDGLSALESYYLASLIPCVPELRKGMLLNFLASQDEDGTIHDRPGLVGQQARWPAPPMLAAQAWKIHESHPDAAFIQEIYPRLLNSTRAWFGSAHDRDQDGFPEWSHPLQAGLEDHPLFSLWHEWGQGAELTVFESPALAAMLHAECSALIRMASLTGDSIQVEKLERGVNSLRQQVEACWDAETAGYTLRDRDTHDHPAGQVLGTQTGNGKMELKGAFQRPRRLLLQLHFQDPSCRPQITLRGRAGGKPVREQPERMDFRWGANRATYTSLHCFTRLAEVDIQGMGAQDEVRVGVLGFDIEDQTLYLPLWAGIPQPDRAQMLVERSLMNPERFFHPYGISAYPVTGLEEWLPRTAEADGIRLGVSMPGCQLIGEGLLGYGLRAEAAQLTSNLMAGIIQNLKKQRAFYKAYHAESGDGMGEQNPVSGLAPLGLFLETLGVRFLGENGVRLEGQNPFPWPVTVTARGLSVTRYADHTDVTFPGGQMVTVTESTPCVVSSP